LNALSFEIVMLMQAIQI